MDKDKMTGFRKLTEHEKALVHEKMLEADSWNPAYQKSLAIGLKCKVLYDCEDIKDLLHSRVDSHMLNNIREIVNRCVDEWIYENRYDVPPASVVDLSNRGYGFDVEFKEAAGRVSITPNKKLQRLFDGVDDIDLVQNHLVMYACAVEFGIID